MFSYLPERAGSAVREHARLIELLEAGGDPAEVERYARWHKMQTVAAYRATDEYSPRRARRVRRGPRAAAFVRGNFR